MHGTCDQVVSIGHGQRLYEVAKHPVKPLWVDNCGHNDLPPVNYFYPALWLTHWSRCIRKNSEYLSWLLRWGVLTFNIYIQTVLFFFAFPMFFKSRSSAKLTWHNSFGFSREKHSPVLCLAPFLRRLKRAPRTQVIAEPVSSGLLIHLNGPSCEWIIILINSFFREKSKRTSPRIRFNVFPLPHPY